MLSLWKPVSRFLLILLLVSMITTASAFLSLSTIAEHRIFGTYQPLDFTISVPSKTIEGVVIPGDVIRYSLNITNPHASDFNVTWRLDNANPSEPLPISAVLRVNGSDWWEGASEQLPKVLLLRGNKTLEIEVNLFVVDLIEEPDDRLISFQGKITFRGTREVPD